jgi:hypothetical protein
MRGACVIAWGMIFGARLAYGQALPQPPDLVAKPEYIALVKATREDEKVLEIVRRQIESEKHAFKAECLTNLRPGLITSSIAWAIEPSVDPQDAADATRFFANITQQPRVMLSVRGEVLDLLNICTDTLEGTRQISYCQSEWVPNADKSCSVRYDVAGRAGESARSTRVSLYCDFKGSDLSSLLTELPGQHETIGLSWRDSRTLELVLPPAVTPRYRQSADPARGLTFDYRTRTGADPPPARCAPTPTIDEFGWPAG